MRYEVIREIFNQCSGNQMRDVFVEEVDLDEGEIDRYMDQYRIGKEIEEEREITESGDIIYNIVSDGLRQRVGFTRVER